MKCVLAASRPIYKNIITELSEETAGDFFYLFQPEELTADYLEKITPDYIFFPHWSYIIPEEIFNSYECIIFHMTDLPFGRGGSPLQNLISRGIYETQITALRCVAEIDAGPVYLKRSLSLHGTAEEIYMRAAVIIKEMIKWIIINQPEPIPQQGEGCFFPRRKPEQSNISDLNKIEQLYDYIRMLDAEGYPKAYLDTEHFHLEFERASLKQGYIKADVIISTKKGND